MIISPHRGKVLLETIHGSRLYGTNHEESDEDYYFITEHGKGKSYKYINEDGIVIDYHVIGIKDHGTNLLKGTHQAIEAAFSEVAEIDPAYEAYFKGLRLYSPELEKTYVRTVKGLCLKTNSAKTRRHAVRIAWNLIDLRAYGRFNPTMTQDRIEISKDLAERFDSDVLWKNLKVFLDNSRSPN